MFTIFHPFGKEFYFFQYDVFGIEVFFNLFGIFVCWPRHFRKFELYVPSCGNLFDFCYWINKIRSFRFKNHFGWLKFDCVTSDVRVENEKIAEKYSCSYANTIFYSPGVFLREACRIFVCKSNYLPIAVARWKIFQWVNRILKSVLAVRSNHINRRQYEGS